MKIRFRNVLILGAIGLGLIPIFVVGLFTYMNATKTPLHLVADAVPSSSSAAGASRDAANWSAAIAAARQVTRENVAKQNLPGLSVAVAIGNDIVWAEGFGWSNLDDKAVVRPDTRFRIGTASIALTSAAAGLLIERGKLNLDEPIQTYVPAYPKKQWPVTLRQLMAHTAGVRSDGGDEGPLFAETCDTAADAVKFIAEYELRAEPGTQYHFSSYGWILVSAAIEAAAGEPYSRFMRQAVFEPLGMDNTKVDTGSTRMPDLAMSYFPKFAADPTYGPDVMRPINLSCFAGAGAFVSTPTDLARFAIAISNGRLLKPETAQLLQASQRRASGEDNGYGLGWDMETAILAGKQVTVTGHDGDLLGGQAASLITLPFAAADGSAQSIAVAVLSNTSYAGAYDIALTIAQVFADKK